MTNILRFIALFLACAALCLTIACSGNVDGRERGVEGMPGPTANKAAPNSNANKMEKETKKRMAEGRWGATGLALAVESDKVLITFDCADARIPQRPELDEGGSFVVEGVFIRRKGGPIRMDDKPNEQPAHFAGKITGQTMALTITFVNSKEEIGNYILEYGKEGRIRRCL